MLHDLELGLGEKRVSARALLDSGNHVRDLYYGRPVIIVSEPVAAGLLDRVPGLETPSADHAAAPQFRLLPASSVGGETLLPAFTADYAEVAGEETRRRIPSPCVAVARDALGGEKYAALLGADAMNGES